MILVLILILLVLMVLVGGNRGALSFVTLVFNFIVGLVSIFFLGIGMSPVLIFIISSLLFCQITLIYQNGYHKKTQVSFLSVVLVLTLMSLLVSFICRNAYLYGMNEIESLEDSMSYLASAVDVNMVSIWVISLLWAELGAIMDTSISISTAMNEIKLHNTEMTKKQLFISGMNIGKDIIGTTVNTLAFVAVGESMMIILYYVRCHYTLDQLINSKAFLQQISAVIFSCLGCLFIIPVTAFLFVQWERIKLIKCK